MLSLAIYEFANSAKLAHFIPQNGSMIRNLAFRKKIVLAYISTRKFPNRVFARFIKWLNITVDDVASTVLAVLERIYC